MKALNNSTPPIHFSRADWIILASTLVFMLMVFSSAFYLQETNHLPQIQNVMGEAIY